MRSTLVPERRRAALWIAANAAGKGVSFGRDITLSVQLGFGATLDNYLLLITPVSLAASSLGQVVQQYVTPSAATGQETRRERLIVVTLALGVTLALIGFGRPICALIGLDLSTGAFRDYVIATSALPVALACGWFSANLHALGKSSFPLAVPVSPGLAVTAAAVIDPTTRNLVLAHAIGWLGDLLILGLLLRRHRHVVESPVRVISVRPSLLPLALTQAAFAATVVMDRAVASRLGDGVASATTVANRLVFAGIAVVIGSMAPHVTVSVARDKHLSGGVPKLSGAVRAGLLATAVLLVLAGTWTSSLFVVAVGVYLAGVGPVVTIAMGSASWVGSGRVWWVAAVAFTTLVVNAVGDSVALATGTPLILLLSTTVASYAGALAVSRLNRHNA